MGQDYRPNRAISIEVMLELINHVEAKLKDIDNEMEAHVMTLVGAYMVSCFCASLRGNEGLMMDLLGLQRNLHYGHEDVEDLHVVFALLGRFKNEVGEQYHLILVASVTQSGLEPRKWIERLVSLHTCQGWTSGLAFCDKHGNVEKMFIYEDIMMDILCKIQELHPNLIPLDIEVRAMYGVFRSLR